MRGELKGSNECVREIVIWRRFLSLRSLLRELRIIRRLQMLCFFVLSACYSVLFFLFYKLNKLNNGIYSIYNALRVMNQCKQFPACFIDQCT